MDSTEYSRAWRASKLAQGLCGKCGKRPRGWRRSGELGFYCKRCRLAKREYQRLWEFRRGHRTSRWGRSREIAIWKIEKKAERKAWRHEQKYADIFQEIERQRNCRTTKAYPRSAFLAYDSMMDLILQGAGFKREEIEMPDESPEVLRPKRVRHWTGQHHSWAQDNTCPFCGTLRRVVASRKQYRIPLASGGYGWVEGATPKCVPEVPIGDR